MKSPVPGSAPILALLCLVLTLSTVRADFQRYAIGDSSGNRHVVDLPSSLEPDRGDSLVYLDSTLALDTLAHPEFMALDADGKTSFKYGRLLGLSLTRVSKDFAVSLPLLKDKARGDSVFQFRMIDSYRTRKRRMVYAGIGAGTGLIVGNILFQVGLGVTECKSTNGDPFECKKSPANGALIGTGLGFMAAGLAVGGALFVIEFDEEKLARKLATGN